MKFKDTVYSIANFPSLQMKTKSVSKPMANDHNHRVKKKSTEY